MSAAEGDGNSMPIIIMSQWQHRSHLRMVCIEHLTFLQNHLLLRGCNLVQTDPQAVLPSTS
ncbi:hypothetical protein [Phormidium sp. FACHB-592]|uniref:hypothetical protein n=1 Tax=Phormidium sp. FACHB-592 TaxID=2692850 RepID=UPI001A7ECC62|nr:hypothetical protein [Phormidium sp. FACHB-592]